MRRFGIALAAVLCLLALPAGALGAIYGLQGPATSQLSFPGSFTSQLITNTCAEGARLLGTGADISINGDFTPIGQVVIDDITPNAALTRSAVKAIPDEDGVEGFWALQSGSLCADPPPGLERVAATSPLDSETKSVTAPCPAGKRVLGTGAEIHGGDGRVLIDDVTPNAGLTSVTVKAVEQDTGTARLWALTAHAICADPIPGLERHALTSELDSGGGKSAGGPVRPCPGEKVRLSGGTDINGGAGQVALAATGYFSSAAEDQDGYAGSWSVTDYAICAPTRRLRSSTDPPGSGSDCARVSGAGAELTGPAAETGQVHLEDIGVSPEVKNVSINAVEDETGADEDWSQTSYAICASGFPGFERAFTVGPLNSSNKSTTVSCPTGKRVLGAFGAINTDGGQVILDDVRPSADLRSVTVQGAEDETGYPVGWSVTASAVCADPPPGLERVAATSELSSQNKAVTATCPGSKRLFGTGVDINGGAGQVVFTAIRPNRGLDSVEIVGVEDENGHSGLWSVTSYAVCGDP